MTRKEEEKREKKTVLHLVKNRKKPSLSSKEQRPDRQGKEKGGGKEPAISSTSDRMKKEWIALRREIQGSAALSAGNGGLLFALSPGLRKGGWFVSRKDATCPWMGLVRQKGEGKSLGHFYIKHTKPYPCFLKESPKKGKKGKKDHYDLPTFFRGKRR